MELDTKYPINMSNDRVYVHDYDYGYDHDYDCDYDHDCDCDYDYDCDYGCDYVEGVEFVVVVS